MNKIIVAIVAAIAIPCIACGSPDPTPEPTPDSATPNPSASPNAPPFHKGKHFCGITDDAGQSVVKPIEWCAPHGTCIVDGTEGECLIVG